MSTLRRYVAALGGEIEVVARFGDKSKSASSVEQRLTPLSRRSTSTASYDPCLASETRPRAVWTFGVPILAIFHRVQPAR